MGPNKTLFVQNVPEDVEEEDLVKIFEGFNGFHEVRHVKVLSVAFVEFENEQHAIAAKAQTTDLRMGKDQSLLKVTYQRK